MSVQKGLLHLVLASSIAVSLTPQAFADTTPVVPEQVVAQGTPVTSVSVAEPPSQEVGVLAGHVSAAPELPHEVIVIDNDDEAAKAQIEETYKWEELPNTPGQTKISTGAKFPVRIVSELNSKTCKVGEVVEAQVRVDVKIGGKMIAPKGTRVVGHVAAAHPARRILVAELSTKRWFRAAGQIDIQFDEMITHDGKHIPLMALPAKQPRIVVNKNEGRVMGVNAKGGVASPLSIQLREQGIHLAIRGAASAAGVFSFGAVPVAYAALGAMNPSFAFLKPVGKNVPHRRLKGAAMGFVSGLPGGFLIADTIIKGPEAAIKPGDEFLVEFKQDFTGEEATDAEMLAGGKRSVHGEVVGRNKDGKKSK
jgi:hypothetical protein